MTGPATWPRWPARRQAGDLPASDQDPAEARERADEILSRPEYQDGESLLERLDRELGELVEGIFDGLGLSVGGGAAGWLGWVVFALLVGAVAAYLGWAVATGRLRRRAGRSGDQDRVVLTAEEGRTVADWTAAAEAHEAEGRWRQGMLCRYRALVVELCDRGVIPDVAGRTAGEYVRDVEAGPRPAGSFAAATALFEEIWYGGGEGGPQARDRFAALATDALAAAAGGGPDGELAREAGV